jgi:predicted nuclease of predicted toxin-antitoxin system
MKLLLDECTPKALKKILTEHYVLTTQKMGWSGLSNGVLLGAAERAGFQIVVTCDKVMFTQQTIIGRKIAIVELPSTELPDLLMIAREIIQTVRTAKPGQYYRISMP